MNTYSENEENQIIREMKQSRFKKENFSNDTKNFVILLGFALFFLSFNLFAENIPVLTTIQCPHCENHINLTTDIAKGVSWTCKKCKRHNYSEVSDWRGDYYCRCGTRKGDE